MRKEKMSKEFDATQHAELESWALEDPILRRDKQIRETIRYPLLKRQMGLDHLDTSEMLVADIGCGPYLGVSNILPCRRADRFDPLITSYARLYPQHNAYPIKAEDLKERLNKYDLIMTTNSLDHFEDPQRFLEHLKMYTKPGAFFALHSAINNSYTHSHEAHAHSLTPEVIHQALDSDFETCWEVKYPEIVYGHRKQPAMAFLMRKATGYGSRQPLSDSVS